MNNWLHDAGYVSNNNNQYCKEFYVNNVISRKVTVVIVQSEWGVTLIEVDETPINTSVKNSGYISISEMLNNFELR
jgi:hypothetical protein